MTIHGSKKKPLSFQEIRKIFPHEEFDYGSMDQQKLKQMQGKGILLVQVKGHQNDAWRVDLSTIPAEETSKFPEWDMTPAPLFAN